MDLVRAECWRQKGEALKQNINKHLWQEGKGFYRMHRALASAAAKRLPEDLGMFHMPGNALAGLDGIAEDT